VSEEANTADGGRVETTVGIDLEQFARDRDHYIEVVDTLAIEPVERPTVPENQRRERPRSQGCAQTPTRPP